MKSREQGQMTNKACLPNTQLSTDSCITTCRAWLARQYGCFNTHSSRKPSTNRAHRMICLMDMI